MLAMLVLACAAAGPVPGPRPTNAPLEAQTEALADALVDADFPRVVAAMEARGQRADNISFGPAADFSPVTFAVGFRLPDVVRALIARNALKGGGEAVAIACRHRDLSTVRALLAAGAPADTGDALFNALTPPDGGDDKDTRALVEALLQAGADPHRPGPTGHPAFFRAAHSADLLQRLLAAGADVHRASAGADLFTRPGTTIVHHAALAGSPEAVAAVLAAGGDATTSDAAGWTPAHYAASSGNLAALRALSRAGADLDATTTRETQILTGLAQPPYPSGSTPLEVARVSTGAYSFRNRADALQQTIAFLEARSAP